VVRESPARGPDEPARLIVEIDESIGLAP